MRFLLILVVLFGRLCEGRRGRLWRRGYGWAMDVAVDLADRIGACPWDAVSCIIRPELTHEDLRDEVEYFGRGDDHCRERSCELWQGRKMDCGCGRWEGGERGDAAEASEGRA